jgi:hypothetical protein
LRCEIISTRTGKNGHPTEFGLLVDRSQVSRAEEMLGPEPRPDPKAIRRGERSLQIALSIGALLAIIWLALHLLRS